MAHLCEHEGCSLPGIECFLSPGDTKPDGYYCALHAQQHGFCYGCGLFWGGIDSFDFGKGLCDNCREDIDENDDDDESDRDEWLDMWEGYPGQLLDEEPFCPRCGTAISQVEQGIGGCPDCW